MASAKNLIMERAVEVEKILNVLGKPVRTEMDPKISVAMRTQFCTIRDELALTKKAFIKIRRAALQKVIEDDYNIYLKELRKYDYAITRTQP